MDWADIIVALALFVIMAGAAYQVITGRGTPAEKLTTLEQAARVAREIVAAVEQLYQTGNLTADERLDYASDQLSALFPQLDADLIRLAIEAAVHWLHQSKPQPAAHVYTNLPDEALYSPHDEIRIEYGG